MVLAFPTCLLIVSKKNVGEVKARTHIHQRRATKLVDVSVWVGPGLLVEEERRGALI